MNASAQMDGRRLALVTGASSGVGRELAQLFAQDGYDLVIAAEADGIEQTANQLRTHGVAVDALRVDLATRDGVEQLAARFGADQRAPDAIALNAGVGLGRAFVDQELGAIFNVIDLNVRGTVQLAHRLLPRMIAQGHGRVLFTSSIAALMPGTFEAVYGATKAFVQRFAEALRNELEDTGVTVTALQPGPTETNFFHRAGMDDTKVGQDPKDDAAAVARQGFEAMVAGKDHVLASSLETKVQGVISEILPEPMKAEMHRKLAEPGGALTECDVARSSRPPSAPSALDAPPRRAIHRAPYALATDLAPSARLDGLQLHLDRARVAAARRLRRGLDAGAGALALAGAQHVPRDGRRRAARGPAVASRGRCPSRPLVERSRPAPDEHQRVSDAAADVGRVCIGVVNAYVLRARGRPWTRVDAGPPNTAGIVRARATHVV